MMHNHVASNEMVDKSNCVLTCYCHTIVWIKRVLKSDLSMIEKVYSDLIDIPFNTEPNGSPCLTPQSCTKSNDANKNHVLN